MKEPDESVIFVFGSNLRGLHGAGAAEHAVRYWGAQWSNSMGLQGQSYAIPTKDKNIKTLPLGKIEPFIRGFIYVAARRPELDFQVTRIGCGLADYRDEEIAPMFKDAPPNVHLPLGWRELAK